MEILPERVYLDSLLLMTESVHFSHKKVTVGISGPDSTGKQIHLSSQK